MTSVSLPRVALQAQPFHQRGQRHDAPLAAVVGAHDEGHVLDRDDHRDRPEHERDHPIDVPSSGMHRMVVSREDGLHGIQRARPDIAKHHPERAHRERRHPRLGGGSRHRTTG